MTVVSSVTTFLSLVVLLIQVLNVDEKWRRILPRWLADRLGVGDRPDPGANQQSGGELAVQRNRSAVRRIEQAAQNRVEISELLDARLYFARLDRAMVVAEKRHGRLPTSTQIHEELQRDDLLRGLGASGFDWLVKCRLIDASRQLRVADKLRLSRESRTARRRVSLALRFLPAKERERYRREWEGEMAALSPGAAARFAVGVLREAPRSGAVLRLRKMFGRLAA